MRLEPWAGQGKRKGKRPQEEPDGIGIHKINIDNVLGMALSFSKVKLAKARIINKTRHTNIRMEPFSSYNICEDQK